MKDFKVIIYAGIGGGIWGTICMILRKHYDLPLLIVWLLVITGAIAIGFIVPFLLRASK